MNTESEWIAQSQEWEVVSLNYGLHLSNPNKETKVLSWVPTEGHVSKDPI